MPHIIQLVLVVLVTSAAWTDLRTRRIPNWLTVTGALLGILLQLWYRGLQGAVTSIEGAAFGLALFVVLFIAGGMGAGDVKLFSAIGALTGPQSLVLVFVFTGLLGGIAAIAVALWRGHLEAKLPYGAVIAGGTFVSLVLLH